MGWGRGGLTMTRQSETLMGLAEEYREKLSRHEVLRDYWADLSLILKGSTARGRADQYSDIDFVFYCRKEALAGIVEGYCARGLSSRKDGLFQPLPDWIGHYNFESYDTLEAYFRERNMQQIWECTNAAVLHDPSCVYENIVSDGVSRLFEEYQDTVRAKYLELQLNLDWLTHPLLRGDKIAVLLYCSNFIRLGCQLCFLLDKKAYPCDKWIFQYLDGTRLGSACKDLFLEYADYIAYCGDIDYNQELERYPQFAKARRIVEEMKSFIRNEIGDQPWLEEWYLYV